MSFNSPLNLADLNGLNSFAINGIDANDRSGDLVSILGDINDDGIDDVLVTSLLVDEHYVIFGDSNIGSNGSVDLATLVANNNGFILRDIGRNPAAISGVGDINDDGIDDFIVGTIPTGGGSGRSFVFLGSSTIGQEGSLSPFDLNGTNGFAISSFARSNQGQSVSGAGDVNGDGINDLIIGAPSADLNNVINVGESYVVFGGSTLGNSRFVCRGQPEPGRHQWHQWLCG